MFRPFETAVSQYGCQMFSYLEYIFVLAFRIFRKCLTRCLDFFELVTLVKGMVSLPLEGGGALPFITYLRYVCSEEVWFLTQVF